VRQSEILAEQLQSALNSRILIEQAKGVLAERAGITVEEAFALIRGWARTHHVRLLDTAQAVIDGTSDLTLTQSG
jgi:AmiR/NasT family two-component response regulator